MHDRMSKPLELILSLVYCPYLMLDAETTYSLLDVLPALCDCPPPSNGLFFEAPPSGMHHSYALTTLDDQYASSH
jgi:hypothetical protein